MIVEENLQILRRQIILVVLVLIILMLMKIVMIKIKKMLQIKIKMGIIMIIVVVIMIRLAVVMINNKSYLFRSFFSRYNTNYKYVFLFPFIVSYFKKDLPDEITEIAN